MELEWFHCRPPTHWELCMRQERGFHTIFKSMYKTMNRGCNTKYIAPTCGPQREGYSAIKNVPATRVKPRLSVVLHTDSREVQALEEFIALKERKINRLVRVDKNLDAILETEWLKDYILTFPSRSIGCNHASFMARRDNDQRRNKPGRTGPASVHRSRYGGRMWTCSHRTTCGSVGAST